MKKQHKRYSKVSIEIWGDDKFTSLTPLRPSGQALWLYLLLSPYRSLIPGLTLNIGLGTLADRLPTWGLANVRKHWNEIERLQMAKADWRTGVIWLPRGIVHNEPESPNVIRSWANVPLPRCGLVTEALESLQCYIAQEMSEAFLKAFREAFGATLPAPFPAPFPESRTRTRTQDPPPQPPPARGGGALVDVSARPLTRKEREFAEQLRAQRQQAGKPACPHDPACNFPLVCVGRIVQEKRLFEASGQRAAMEDVG